MMSFARSTSAAFFDLDKTILATSSAIALQGSFVDAGFLSRRAAMMSVLVHLPYLLRGADEDRMNAMAQAIGDLAKGWDASLLEATVEESLAVAIDPVCYTQALDRIAYHRALGEPVVIASASVREIVRPIAKMLGADFVLSSVAEVDESGKYTGGVIHFNQAENKAAACAELAEKQGWDMPECWAYSDSVSDTPLLESVGHPVAVNPDHALRALALERGWEIMRFSETVRVRPRRLTRLQEAAIAASLVGLAAGVAIGAALVSRGHEGA